MVSERTAYTVDDLPALNAEFGDQRLELSAGEVIVMAPASGLHGQITVCMGLRVSSWVKHQRLGIITAAGTGYNLSGTIHDTVRAPDLGFIKAERVPGGVLSEGYVPFAPDLAVEVISPNDSAEYVQTKVEQYLRAGTAQVWLVYPTSRSVTVWDANGARAIGIDGVIDGGDLLPGFTLNVRAIFPK